MASQQSLQEWDFTAGPDQQPRLPSGGIYPPYGHIGHWEVTGKVIEEMGFSAPACEILCDAAQDPDFYDFGTAAAHAQTPDAADCCGTDADRRTRLISKAVDSYVEWVAVRFRRGASSLAAGDVRLSLYWLGYALHGVEDLAVHQGITNGEHAASPKSPDYQAADVALSYVYARRALDAVRNALGQQAFDRLRNHDGDGRLGFWEKHRAEVHPSGWDIDNCYGEYKKAGKKYQSLVPPPPPVRWDRECVLSRVLEIIDAHRITRRQSSGLTKGPLSANPQRRFKVLKPLEPLSRPAEWTVLVYLAGDDRNPRGIEYAIAQDLEEIKRVGSTEAVHFLAQTDDASGNASYRYRLRKGTALDADRLERFDGDLNTGSTKTLVDFVQWAHHLFPARRTALVLWGHGSGHDDQDVYRAVRGAVNPRTASRMAQRRLGFFSGTRRSLLEQGPTRGYGYDDTAGDFLDNAELRKALLQVKEILGRKLAILGFDACLMAMVEVAYQIHDVADILVASERSEPGNGWNYTRAFGRLPGHPATRPDVLANDIVEAYRKAYRDDMTLSAVNLRKIPELAGRFSEWARAADPADFHRLRRYAIDCSPRSGEGYCDLGTFLEAASDPACSGNAEALRAGKALGEAIMASCGKTSGLTLYAPGNFRPRQAGSTDALYLGLNFVRKTLWGDFLGKVYPPLKKAPPDVDTLPIPTPVTGLDRFNARRVLAAVRSRAAENWLDRLRGDVLGPCMEAVCAAAEQLDTLDPPKDRLKTPPDGKDDRHILTQKRILILPGIMGSLLHDRSGKLGTVWIDPWNLVFGEDFAGLKLGWDGGGTGAGKSIAATMPVSLPVRVPDADAAVRIEAFGVVPLIYDRLALALMREFGPVVEFAPYDWRQPLDFLGTGLADRIKALVERHPDLRLALVAHSMGGLVLADALTKLDRGGDGSTLNAIRALVVMGVPFLGSYSALQTLRAERSDLRLLQLLGWKSAAEIEETVQTFRGLFDLLPGDRPELLQGALFAPGPLSRLQSGDPRLSSPLALVRDLPVGLRPRTCAVYCDTKGTIGSVQVRADGSVDYSDTVGGDGTVTAGSALNGESLLPGSREVEEGHMMLPLDGAAIGHAVGWIA